MRYVPLVSITMPKKNILKSMYRTQLTSINKMKYFIILFLSLGMSSCQTDFSTDLRNSNPNLRLMNTSTQFAASVNHQLISHGKSKLTLINDTTYSLKKSNIYLAMTDHAITDQNGLTRTYREYIITDGIYDPINAK